MLQKMAKWVAKQRESTEVDVELGGKTVKATLGKTLFAASGEYDIYEHSVDFLIRVELLDGKPTPSDEIIYNGKTYAVVSFKNEPPVRFTDAYNTTYRIHTKLID